MISQDNDGYVDLDGFHANPLIITSDGILVNGLNVPPAYVQTDVLGGLPDASALTHDMLQHNVVGVDVEDKTQILQERCDYLESENIRLLETIECAEGVNQKLSKSSAQHKQITSMLKDMTAEIAQLKARYSKMELALNHALPALFEDGKDQEPDLN